MDTQNNFFVAYYFSDTQTVARSSNKKNMITMQFFQNCNNVVLSGIRHVLILLKENSSDYQQLKIYALQDGDYINAGEVVLSITGYYWNFAFLEGRIDGILCRETTIATNAFLLVEAAGKKQIIYMNDRNNFAMLQPYDGYAAYIGGVRLFTAPAQIALIKKKQALTQTFASLPHSFIQLYQGNLLEALVAYRKVFPQKKIIALLDFHNDCISEIMKIKALMPCLFAVRIDTAVGNTDQFLVQQNQHQLSGVQPLLVHKARTVLNKIGGKQVKIVVSGGFDVAKIKHFQAKKAPVDYFGVGAAFNQNIIYFTGDAVKNNHQLCAKAGRVFKVNPRWTLVQ